MSYLTEISRNLEQAFSSESLAITINQDHVLVNNSQHLTIEKTQQIIKNLNLCPLIFKCQSTGNIKFTLVPYKLPINTLQKKLVNIALAWGEEISSGAAKSVSEFNSSIDDILKKYLGEHFFKNNVAKVILNGYKFVFVADRHSQKCFGGLLLPNLIQEVNQRKDKTIALFIESCERNASFEAKFYLDHLGGQKVEGLLYGMERNDIFMISTWLMAIHQLSNKGKYEGHQNNLLYELLRKKSSQNLWNELKKSRLNSELKTMVVTIDQALQESQTNMSLGLQILQKCQFFNDPKIWRKLYNQLILILVEKSDFGDGLQTKIKEVLTDPLNDIVFSECMLKINNEVRDPAIVNNIRAVIQKVPQTTEIIVYVGYVHMYGIIQGLQKAWM